jgi:hypothetical protein
VEDRLDDAGGVSGIIVPDFSRKVEGVEPGFADATGVVRASAIGTIQSNQSSLSPTPTKKADCKRSRLSKS